MVVSRYFDSIEGTEKEQVFFSGLKELTKDEEVQAALAKAQHIPVAGKLLTAIIALAESESIAEFKQTKHYDSIKDWGITVSDPEKGHISLYPGPTHMKKIIPVLAIIALVILFICLRKCRKKTRCK